MSTRPGPINPFELETLAKERLPKEEYDYRQLAEENYNASRDSYSFPPRLGRKGMQGVLDIIQTQSGRPKSEFDMNRFVDESLIDELEREGFYQRIEPRTERK